MNILYIITNIIITHINIISINIILINLEIWNIIIIIIGILRSGQGLLGFTPGNIVYGVYGVQACGFIDLIFPFS